MPSGALIPLSSTPRQDDASHGILTSPGVGYTVSRFFKIAGTAMNPLLNLNFDGPLKPESSIKTFFSDGKTRERALDELYKAYRDDLAKHKTLLKHCRDLLKYATPEETVETQLITFEILVKVITQYPGIRPLFHHPKVSKVSLLSPSEIKSRWSRPHDYCDEKWRFYLDFVAYCLPPSNLTNLVESELPSKFGQLNPLENNLNKERVEELLSYCRPDLDLVPEKLCAIRYLASILELPKFWELNTEEGKEIAERGRLFDFLSTLCKTIFQLIRDTEPSGSNSDGSPLWESARKAVDTLTFVTLDGFLYIHHLDKKLPACPPQLPEIISLLIRPEMQSSFPKAFGCAPSVKEILRPPSPERHIHENDNDEALNMEALLANVASGAIHNSTDRHDPPNCHPGTRVQILQEIMDWIKAPNKSEFFLWLYGSAGTGKSSIAQTIAELCHEQGLLAASFFFSKRAAGLNNVNFLIPTLAYQLVMSIPDIRQHISASIDQDPLIFTRSLEAQFEVLILQPLSHLPSDSAESLVPPRLIVIDGLDECDSPETQARILTTLLSSARRNRPSLFFLIASRPVLQIARTFEEDVVFSMTRRLALDDIYEPDTDIRIFLFSAFQQIKSQHPRRDLIPAQWPPSSVLDHLVRKSSGHFIYASTAVKFIGSPRHNPIDRLDIILGSITPANNMPFAELDAMYTYILSVVEDIGAVLQVFSFLLVFPTEDPRSRTAQFIEAFLHYEEGELQIILADLHSIIFVPSPTEPEDHLRILHPSLGDFLMDRSRSRQFFIDPAKARAKWQNSV